MATSRWVTDFSICESCCCGFMWSASGGGGPQRGEVCVGAECGMRRTDERLTFLGARRDDPCEERTDEASSVMAGGVQAALRVCEWGRAGQTVASSTRRRGRDGRCS